MPTGYHCRQISSLLAIAAAECKLRLSAHTGRLCACRQPRGPRAWNRDIVRRRRVRDERRFEDGPDGSPPCGIPTREVGHRGSSRWGGEERHFEDAVRGEQPSIIPAVDRTVAAVSSPEVLGSGRRKPAIVGRFASAVGAGGIGRGRLRYSASFSDTRREGRRRGCVPALPRVKRRAVRAAHRQRRAETAPLLQGGVPARERRGTLRCRHGRVRLVTAARGSTSVTPAGAVVFDMRS